MIHNKNIVTITLLLYTPYTSCSLMHNYKYMDSENKKNSEKEDNNHSIRLSSESNKSESEQVFDIDKEWENSQKHFYHYLNSLIKKTKYISYPKKDIEDHHVKIIKFKEFFKKYSAEIDNYKIKDNVGDYAQGVYLFLKENTAKLLELRAKENSISVKFYLTIIKAIQDKIFYRNTKENLISHQISKDIFKNLYYQEDLEDSSKNTIPQLISSPNNDKSRHLTIKDNFLYPLKSTLQNLLTHKSEGLALWIVGKETIEAPMELDENAVASLFLENPYSSKEETKEIILGFLESFKPGYGKKILLAVICILKNLHPEYKLSLVDENEIRGVHIAYYQQFGFKLADFWKNTRAYMTLDLNDIEIDEEDETIGISVRLKQ